MRKASVVLFLVCLGLFSLPTFATDIHETSSEITTVDLGFSIPPGVAGMGAAGQREFGVEADNGQTGRHGATDYP